MNYALQTLENEIGLIKRALSTWEQGKHPEAKKERERRLNELNKAVLSVNCHDELVEALIEANNFTKDLIEEGSLSEESIRGNDFIKGSNKLIQKATE